MTNAIQDPNALPGAAVLGANDDKLGKVVDVYFDNESNEAQWASVKTGLFGGNVSLIPLDQAQFDGQDLRVPFDNEALKTAPHHDPGTDLSPQDEQDLYTHYGVAYGDAQSADHQNGGDVDGDRRDRSDDAGVQGQDTSGPTTDEAMTRSEEQLHVGTQTQETGRARLRKHIVTENVTTTVPVSREEVTLDREPITDANRGDALRGGDLTEEEHEVVLTEERPVVSKETVPVERVRLGKETVTGEEQVNEQVRKEQVETDTAGPAQR